MGQKFVELGDRMDGDAAGHMISRNQVKRSIFMSTRLNDPKTGAKVIVMQRVHGERPRRARDKEATRNLILPAEYERSRHVTSIGWSDPRNELGELLCRERFGPAEVEQQKRDLSSYAAAAQLQQRPAPAEGGILKRLWWRYYREAPRPFDEVIQSWDCAFKETNASDCVVGQVWGASTGTSICSTRCGVEWGHVHIPVSFGLTEKICVARRIGICKEMKGDI